MWDKRRSFCFFHQNWTFEWLTTVGLVRIIILFWVMYTTTRSRVNHAIIVQIYKLCCIHLMLNGKILSSLYFPFLCLLLCYVYHITVGEGHRCGEEEADGYEVGQSALLKLMQSCCRLWFVLGTECKTDACDHAHISANCWVVEPVFFRLNTKQYIYSYLDALSAV